MNANPMSWYENYFTRFAGETEMWIATGDATATNNRGDAECAEKVQCKPAARLTSGQAGAQQAAPLPTSRPMSETSHCANRGIYFSAEHRVRCVALRL
jgi:hypothetical protein